MLRDSAPRCVCAAARCASIDGAASTRPTNEEPNGEGDVAGASVLTGAVLDLRLDALTDGRTAFINVTRSMLLNGVATLLRPSLALYELREDIDIDREVIEACRALSESGYRLASDDFVPGSDAEVLLPYVSHVKVDTLVRAREVVAALARSCRCQTPRGRHCSATRTRFVRSSTLSSHTRMADGKTRSRARRRLVRPSPGCSGPTPVPWVGLTSSRRSDLARKSNLLPPIGDLDRRTFRSRPGPRTDNRHRAEEHGGEPLARRFVEVGRTGLEIVHDVASFDLATAPMIEERQSP